MAETVLLTQQDTVATITLNRPQSFHALDFALGEDLVAAVERCHSDDRVKAVILTATGRAFCSGGDMRAAHDHIARGADPAHFFRDLTKLLHRVITDLRLLPKPVIAAVNGTVAGAGFSLAMACDLRLAAASAKFKQAYTSMALVPDGGWTASVPALVGMARASELLLLDPVLDAPQALQLGLVNRVVADEELALAAAQIAQRLAAGPVLAYAKSKALLNAALLPFLEQQLERERQAIIACGASEDFRQGVEAFVAKRAPTFVGR